MDSHAALQRGIMDKSVPASDQLPAGTDLIQHTWNRRIAEFVQAIRPDDVAHHGVPHLPTLVDGLRNEEIIAASDVLAAAGAG